MLIASFNKEPGDKYSIVLEMHDSIMGLDYITVSEITASLQDDSTSDQTAVVINKVGSPPAADLVQGTATGGSSTTLIDTTKDFKAEGVRVGAEFINTTLGWRAKVKAISTTTNANDTVEFDAAPAAVVSTNAYKFLLARIPLKGGVDATTYRLTALITTNQSQVTEDTFYMTIADK